MIHRREFLALSAAAAGAAAQVQPLACEVFVYGSTPGGVTAAVEAARRGMKVILACPKKHLGGMAASGLSTTDAVRPQLFGGLVAEFIRRVRDHYATLFEHQPDEFKLIKDGWFYEPSVAELVFDHMVAAEEKMLRWRPGHHLTSAKVDGQRVVSVELEAPDGATLRISAKTFIDGTYEGDLAGAAHVPCRVGRESKSEYGEPFAGIHYMNWRTGRQIMTPDTGEASPAIQAFCARSIFTDDPAQRVTIEKPVSYAEHLPDYLPLLEDFASGRVTRWSKGTLLPRRKFQMNGNIEALTSINIPGASWTWPEAARHHRARLEAFHVDHVAGLIWFLQHDPRVPSAIRESMAPLGLHKEEFRDSGHWPWQILSVRAGVLKAALL